LTQLLRVLTPAIADGTADAAAEFSVSASEGRALVQLLAAHGIAQGELASLLGLEKSTVSRLAAGLEQKGWIRRGRDEGNQRYVRLYLTPAGTEIAAKLWQSWQSRQARIMASLTDAERAGLATGLGGLLRGLVAEGILGDAAPPSATAASAQAPTEAPAETPTEAATETPAEAPAKAPIEAPAKAPAHHSA